MDYNELHEKFHIQVYPSKPNDWDIEEALEELVFLDEEQQLLLLQALPTVWPISHSLSFSLLKEGSKNGRKFDQHSMAEWLRRILSNYEEGGLKKARQYMAESDIDQLFISDDPNKVLLQDCLGRLVPYTQGLSGLHLEIRSADQIYTDTQTLFLPEKINFFPSTQQNYLTYCLFVGLQSSFINLGTFGRHRFSSEVDGNRSTISALEYFNTFKEPELAKVLYQLIEIKRAMGYLQKEFPGLIRETADVRRKLFLLREDYHPLLDHIYASILLPERSEPSQYQSYVDLFDDVASIEHFDLRYIYGKLKSHVQIEQPFSFYPFMDGFNFSEAERVREDRIEENRKKFETILADFLAGKDLGKDTEMQPGHSEKVDGARIQLSDNQNQSNSKTPRPMLQIDNEEIELPENITDLIAQIMIDNGELPEGYVAAAFGLAGQGITVDQGGQVCAANHNAVFLPYDEWDYRRQGYRKNWCSLRERVIEGVKSHFVEHTLHKYHYALSTIRRQFELMRTQERFEKRRRHGNDIDLDALTDSHGDRLAGLPPSEKIYVRLIRNDRSISTCFLVDMSNSTEGWIGVAIKEALVLLCEAMEVIGDTYSIYGFSGMRRTRSELYKVKDSGEPYNSDVKKRLAAIGPKEYTRMGPPIRHLIKSLKQEESKSKLLLILSDGKPEDYDDYKGRYAIEDTKKALAEARGQGIHTYCITIDREAHDYLQHMFGMGNYMFVKNIKQLPSRLIEIYRVLTK